MNEQAILHTEFSTPLRRVLSATTLAKDSVRNRLDENVGSIRDIMIDVPSGRIAYAVLGVGGFLGIGERLFAIPWESLTLDEDEKCFILDVNKERLERAPGFDQDNWPDMVNPAWENGVRGYWRPSQTTSSAGSSEGDDYGVAAGRRYDREAADFADSQVEESSREARIALDSPEGASLRQAEQIGKSRGKVN